MGQGEGVIVAGTGAQIGNLSRWGDYSSMNIDPTDDCTFWYTQEYMGASGSFKWHTRVGAFKFATCGAVANDFSITVSLTSQTVNAGASTTYTINTAVTAGVAQAVNLSVSGLPAGVTASFNPASVTAGTSSFLDQNSQHTEIIEETLWGLASKIAGAVGGSDDASRSAGATRTRPRVPRSHPFA